MIHFHRGLVVAASTRVGLLFGNGTFAYLPCDCTIGAVAVHVVNIGSGVARAEVSLVQGGALIGSPIVVAQGPPQIWFPLDDGTVLPAVDATNLDDDAQLSWDIAITGSAAAGNASVRLGIELIPVDAALRGAQIITLYATGEFTGQPSLFQTSGPFGAFLNPGFGVGYARFSDFSDGVHPVLTDYGSMPEQAEAASPNPDSYIGGAATPAARAGFVRDLMLITNDPVGFDGDYTVAVRKNGHDALSVAATNDGNRIVTSGSSVAPFDRGDQFNFACTQDSGALLTGHVLALWVPVGAQSIGGGFGAGGLGATGFGGASA